MQKIRKSDNLTAGNCIMGEKKNIDICAVNFGQIFFFEIV